MPTSPELADLICYFEGDFRPLRDARLPLMTHAFLYGTAVFEGIRGYWNPETAQLYILRLREHLERLRHSARILQVGETVSAEKLSELVLDLVRRNDFHQDIYIRPSFYASSQIIGVRLHNLDHELYIVALPFGDYVDVEHGLSVGVSSWRRVSDNAIPARAKITGAYANSAFAKSEAEAAGFAEAVVLTESGHVSEGSAENLFIVRDGRLVTPPVSDDILEGITRASLMELAADLGISVLERSIDRTELYVADEVLLCGTGAQVAAVTKVDQRPVGDGRIGPITTVLAERYFAAVRGKLPAYEHWLTKVYPG
jgi:branched-chain amino acid aminotransferase